MKNHDNGSGPSYIKPYWMEGKVPSNNYHEAPAQFAVQAEYNRKLVPNLILEAWIYPVRMLQEINAQKNLQEAGKMKKYLDGLSPEDLERHFQQIIEMNRSYPDNLGRPYFF